MYRQEAGGKYKTETVRQKVNRKLTENEQEETDRKKESKTEKE